MREPLPPGMRQMLIGSAAVHGGVIIVALIASLWAGEPKAAPKAITTKLVRLGKKRPKEWLPRKTQAPKPAKKQAAPVKTPTKAKAPPKKTGPAEKQKSLADVLSQLRKDVPEEELEGDPDGSEHGNTSDLTKAILGNKFATEIHNCIQQHYFVRGVDPKKVAGKTASVVVRVAGSGKFLEWRVEQSSGQRFFDQSVLAAVKRCGGVSAPPKELSKSVRNDGVQIDFTP